MYKVSEISEGVRAKDHLLPDFEKTKIDSLHSRDFARAILEPIIIASSMEPARSITIKTFFCRAFAHFSATFIEVNRTRVDQ